MNRFVRVLLAVLAIALAAGTLVTALHDVSTTWDVWYYHLPFAARLWRIVPSDAYELSAINAERFRGYPLLGELLQGLFWKAFGFPQAANLVALGSLAIYVVYLRKRFAVPKRLALVALMAIPLVHTHATSSYVDLPANVGAAIVVLGAYRIVIRREPADGSALIEIGFAAAAAANMRFQLNPAIALALVAIGARVLGPKFRALGGSRRLETGAELVAIAAALAIVFATPLKNLALHHNPAYPVELRVAGHTLPHAEDAYAYAPPSIAAFPQPVRFLCSILEVGAKPFSDSRRWTIDQWAPSDSSASRIGGSFGVYVVACAVALAFAAWRRRDAEAKRALGFVAVVATVTSFMPQSHELRYYLYWEIVLVSLVLHVATRAPGAGEDGGSAWFSSAIGIGAVVALAVVVAVTRAAYVFPSGWTFAGLLHDKVDARVLEQIRDGERVCLDRAPWTMLYAAPFHPDRHYVVREVESRQACGDVRWIEP